MNRLFDEAFAATIGIEGGYVNDEEDKGGETKFGISKRSYPSLDIKNLSLDDAKVIYLKDYWTSYGDLSNLPRSIAIEVFDTGVNMGARYARKLLQEALNLLNKNEKTFKDLKVDGFIGAMTVSAVFMVQERKLLKVLNGLQFSRYVDIAESSKSQERFFGGWIERT